MGPRAFANVVGDVSDRHKYHSCSRLWLLYVIQLQNICLFLALKNNIIQKLIPKFKYTILNNCFFTNVRVVVPIPTNWLK